MQRLCSLFPSVLITCEKKHNHRSWHIFNHTKQTAKQIQVHKSTIKHARWRKNSTPPHWRLRGKLGTGQVVSMNLGVRRDWEFIIDDIPCGALVWNSMCENFSLCSLSKEINWDRMCIILALINLNPWLQKVKYEWLSLLIRSVAWLIAFYCSTPNWLHFACYARCY